MKKQIFMAAGAIVVLLVVAVYLLFTRGIASAEIQQYRDILADGHTIVDSAKSEVDKERVKELLLSAEAKAKQVMTVRTLRGEATKLFDEIQDVRFTLDEVIKVTNPLLVADVSKVNSNVSLLGIKKLGGSLFVYENDKLYEIIAGDVKDPITILDDGKLLSVAVFDEFESLVFLLDNGQIKEYGSGILKAMDLSGELKQATYVATFGSRIYLLDEGNGQIWRYQRNRDSYGAAQAYFDEPTVSNATSIGIDGAVYVAGNLGMLDKYYIAEKVENFKIIDSPLLPLETTTDIFTAEEIPYVYILEADKKRVLQFYKNPGNEAFQYSNQYFFDTLDQIRGFTVDYAGKKLYVITPTQVYSTDLDI